MDKQGIQKEAKLLLDKFATALAKVEKKKDASESHIDREEFERKEGEGAPGTKDFKKMILDNAPESSEDFIIVERGNWK